MLTPARRRGVEILDDPHVDPDVRERSLSDVARSNRLLGGLRSAIRELSDVMPRGGAVTLLDVGTGFADIPAAARVEARSRGLALTTIGVDEAESLLSSAAERLDLRVCADALALPFRDHSVDVAICSQLLHHFEERDAEQVLRELNRVARRAVIVSDLRRSWAAALGFLAISFPLRFHRVTRHDGVISVLRGFVPRELDALVHAATGARPLVRRRLGFRLTARWTPTT